MFSITYMFITNSKTASMFWEKNVRAPEKLQCFSYWLFRLLCTISACTVIFTLPYDCAKQELPVDSILCQLNTCRYLYMTVSHMRLLSFCGIGTSFVYFPQDCLEQLSHSRPSTVLLMEWKKYLLLYLRDFTWKAYWTTYTFHLCVFL